MDEILVLQEKAREVDAKLSALVEGAAKEKRALSAEEITKHDELEAEFNGLTDSIERLKKAEQRKQLLGKPAASPRIETVREEDFDEAGNPKLYREVSRGGYGDFLLDVKLSAENRTPEKLAKLQLALGANSQSGADGGFLHQPDHVDYMFTNAIEQTKLASLCREVATQSNEVVFNMVDESSRATGSRAGGVRAYRVGEGASATPSKPSFKQTRIPVGKLVALMYATDEQLADASQLQSFASQAFPEEIAWVLDDEIIGGTGAGGQCLGLLNSNATIEVAKEGSQTADTVNFQNIQKMYNRMSPRSRGNARWFVHPDVMQQLMTMVWTPGSNTDFAPFLPAGGVSGQPYNTLFGRPIEVIEQGRALGDAGDIIFADLSRYILAMRMATEMAQSAHVAFLTHEQAFRWTNRVGGMPEVDNPITDAYGTTTRSAFVSLAARA